MAKATAKLQTPGGLFPTTHYGNEKPALRGQLEIDTDITFEDPFCSLHPTTSVGYGDNATCSTCDSNTLNAIQFASASIPCSSLKHAHECKCWFGHECGETCEVYKKAAVDQKDEDGNSIGPNAMLILAAQARSDVMMSVCARLTHLESENTALRQSIAGLLDLLTEETREALGRAKVLARPAGPTPD